MQDLFLFPKLQPQRIKDIIFEVIGKYNGYYAMNLDDTLLLIAYLKEVGFTCSIDKDDKPYNLRKI
jgi:hypothetical protein